MLRKITSFSLLTVFSLLAFSIIPAPKVSAAAECYSYLNGAKGYTAFNCEDIKRQYPDFQPGDGCYKAESLGLGNIGAWWSPPQSVSCDEVRDQRPAQCYVVQSQDVGGEKVNVTKKTPCTADIKARISATGTTVNTNGCYMVDMNASGGQFSAGNVDCAKANEQVWLSQAELNDAQARAEQSEKTAAAQKELEQDQDRVECSNEQECLDPENNPLTKYLVVAINFLSGAVAIVVTIVIVMAGIQYSTAGGDPGKTAQAKKHILNAIIALLAYFTLFMFMQWLVPGGFLN